MFSSASIASPNGQEIKLDSTNTVTIREGVTRFNLPLMLNGAHSATSRLPSDRNARLVGFVTPVNVYLESSPPGVICTIVFPLKPVSVGGMTIYQGDLLHGDCNGVTTIPHEIASEVPDACKELMSAEDIILNYLKQDGITSAGMAFK